MVRLTHLSLEHYRNHSNLSLDLSEGRVHLFLGENGSGKTNILEAIGCFAYGHSMLGVEDEAVVGWDRDFFRVRAEGYDDGESTRLIEICCALRPRKQRAFFLNDVRAPWSRVLGRCPVVTFLPSDLELFTDGPEPRRRFLDQLLCQVHPDYDHALSTYRKALRQRNALLKNLAKGEATLGSLAPWDDALAVNGSIITLCRLELLETLGLAFGNELTSLGEADRDPRIAYVASVAGHDRASIEQALRSRIAETRERDMAALITTVGPHRDDWTVLFHERPIHDAASRGQQRVCLLALLFLQASFLELRTGERPLILLDDIFSELDARHREHVLSALSGNQVFLTAVEQPADVMGDVCVWRVAGGRVRTERSVRLPERVLSIKN